MFGPNSEPEFGPNYLVDFDISKIFNQIILIIFEMAESMSELRDADSWELHSYVFDFFPFHSAYFLPPQM